MNGQFELFNMYFPHPVNLYFHSTFPSTGIFSWLKVFLLQLHVSWQWYQGSLSDLADSIRGQNSDYNNLGSWKVNFLYKQV